MVTKGKLGRQDKGGLKGHTGGRVEVTSSVQEDTQGLRNGYTHFRENNMICKNNTYCKGYE